MIVLGHKKRNGAMFGIVIVGVLVGYGFKKIDIKAAPHQINQHDVIDAEQRCASKTGRFGLQGLSMTSNKDGVTYLAVCQDNSQVSWKK